MKKGLWVITGVFALMLLGIIVLADCGKGDICWGWWLARVPNGDKVGHVVLFGILSFLGNLCFEKRLGMGVTWVSFWIFCFFSVEEALQAYQPFRTCDIKDWYANVGGLVLGQLAAIVVLTWVKKKKSLQDNGN